MSETKKDSRVLPTTTHRADKPDKRISNDEPYCRLSLRECPRCGGDHSGLPWFRAMMKGKYDEQARRPAIWTVCPTSKQPVTGFYQKYTPINASKLILPGDPRIAGGLSH